MARSEDLVAAVRADKLVGRGTCTSIDEAYEDAELAALVADCEDAAAAVKRARDTEELWLERGLDARWGEEDDPQLSVWKEWERARKAVEREERRRAPRGIPFKRVYRGVYANHQWGMTIERDAVRTRGAPAMWTATWRAGLLGGEYARRFATLAAARTWLQGLAEKKQEDTER